MTRPCFLMAFIIALFVGCSQPPKHTEAERLQMIREVYTLQFRAVKQKYLNQSDTIQLITYDTPTRKELWRQAARNLWAISKEARQLQPPAAFTLANESLIKAADAFDGAARILNEKELPLFDALLYVETGIKYLYSGELALANANLTDG